MHNPSGRLVLPDFFGFVDLNNYLWVCLETGVAVHMNFIRKYLLSISWLIITIFTLVAGAALAIAGSFGGAVCALMIAVMSAYVIYEFDWPILWGPMLSNAITWVKSRFK